MCQIPLLHVALQPSNATARVTGSELELICPRKSSGECSEFNIDRCVRYTGLLAVQHEAMHVFRLYAFDKPLPEPLAEHLCRFRVALVGARFLVECRMFF